MVGLVIDLLHKFYKQQWRHSSWCRILFAEIMSHLMNVTRHNHLPTELHDSDVWFYHSAWYAFNPGVIAHLRTGTFQNSTIFNGYTINIDVDGEEFRIRANINPNEEPGALVKISEVIAAQPFYYDRWVMFKTISMLLFSMPKRMQLVYRAPDVHYVDEEYKRFSHKIFDGIKLNAVAHKYKFRYDIVISPCPMTKSALKR